MDRRSDRGFTLLEVLVAFAILTVALGALLLAFSDGLRTTERSATISTATLQAQSLMEEVGTSIPVRRGQVKGVLEDGSVWEVSIEPLETDENGSAGAVPRLLAFRIDVRIEWRPGSTVTLTSLRLAPEDA